MKIFNLRNIFSLVLIFAFNFDVNAQNSTIEEEKRLFYVGCTRAKDHLLFTGNASKKSNNSESLNSFLDFICHFSSLDYADESICFTFNDSRFNYPLYANSKTLSFSSLTSSSSRLSTPEDNTSTAPSLSLVLPSSNSPRPRKIITVSQLEDQINQRSSTLFTQETHNPTSVPAPPPTQTGRCGWPPARRAASASCASGRKRRQSRPWRLGS